ncbi:MAG: acyl-CoA dehydrogenase family protein [Ruoffia tabacinasalis]|uniref:acyl-CoA dehydrogenase family protein n=1 Tax=unclassified Ruoffia TaxID=2862149 RepID=UPI000EDD7A9C|nr:glutaryl-CoA dehydrogenase [Aerococcaceae bacterium]
MVKESRADKDFQEEKFFYSDLYNYSSKLTEGEKEVLAELEEVLKNDLHPVLAKHWHDATFPLEEVQKILDLNLMDDPRLLEGREDGYISQLFRGFRSYTIAKTDPVLGTFYTQNGGLYHECVRLGGSEEQVAELMPGVRSFDNWGALCMTEPDHGSDVAGGMATTATRDGDTWTLNGHKKWVGGASIADMLAIFARDTEDGQVKMFYIPRETEGVETFVTPEKAFFRSMPNAEIIMKDVKVPESQRAQKVNSWKDVAKILRNTRSDVAWLLAGATAGAFEAALKYTREREQFGKPIASFQLIQEKLARMAMNAQATLAFAYRLAEQQEEGIYKEEASSMAKLHNGLRARETAALAREVAGGNGLLLKYDIPRFFADIEGMYTYEGTHEVNSLIIGRYYTGIGAFI